MTLIREIPLPEFVDRQERMVRALGKIDGRLDPAAIQAILLEGEALELREGARYRVTTYVGTPDTAIAHGHTAEGVGVTMEIPSYRDPRFLTLEGTYLGRTGTGPRGGPLAFRIAGEQAAVIADIDVQRIEAIDGADR